MSDKLKTRLSVVLYLSMFVLPVVALAIGWIGWGFRVGAIAALSSFAACFVAASLLLATVNDLSWIAVFAPFSVAVAYAVLPDFLVGPFDDSIVLAAGALMTFGLWLRKQPDTPKWVVLPLLASAVYVLVGGVIPGPVDELLVALIGGGIAVYGSRMRPLPSASVSPAGEDAPIEAQVTVHDE